MNAQEFVFWLQGYFEISGAKTLGEKEVQIVKDHLNLVFEKKTPQYWTNYPLQQQGQQLLLEGVGGSGQGSVTVNPNDPQFGSLQTFVTC
jgi:hypothetical protein